MSDTIRISEDGKICVVDRDSEAVLEVNDDVIINGDLTVNGQCTCEGAHGTYDCLNTVYVSNDYGGEDSDGSIDKPYTTIQEAIEKASSNNIIYILEGIYTEAVQLPQDKNLVFRGAPSQNVTVMLPETLDETDQPYIFSKKEKEEVEEKDSSELLIEPSFVFENLILSGKEIPGIRGISVVGGGRVKVKGCHFKYLGWDGQGVALDGPGTTEVVLDYNSAATDLYNSYSSTISASGEAYSSALYIEKTTTLEIRENVFIGNLRAITAVTCGDEEGGYGLLLRNSIVNTLYDAIVLDCAGSVEDGCRHFTLNEQWIRNAGCRGMLINGGRDVKVAHSIIESCWINGIEFRSVGDTFAEGCHLSNCCLSDKATSGEETYEGPEEGDSSETTENERLVSGSVVISGEERVEGATYTAKISNGIIHMDVTAPSATQTRGIVLRENLHHVEDSSIHLVDNKIGGFKVGTRFMSGAIGWVNDDEEFVRTVSVIHNDNTYDPSNVHNLVNDDTDVHADYIETPFGNLYPNSPPELNIKPVFHARSVVIEPTGNMFSFKQLCAARKPDNMIVIRELHQEHGNRIQFDDIDPSTVTINGEQPWICMCDDDKPLDQYVNCIVAFINAALRNDCSPCGLAPLFFDPPWFDVIEDCSINFLPTCQGNGLTFGVHNLPLGMLLVDEITGLIQGSAPKFKLESGENNQYSWQMTAANSAGSNTVMIGMNVLQNTPSANPHKSVRFGGYSTHEYAKLNDTSFDGDGFPMYKGDPSSSNQNDAWTLSMWIKLATDASSSDLELFKYGGLLGMVTGSGDTRNLRLCLGTYFFGSFSSSLHIRVDGVLSLGRWHHVVFTYDGNACGGGIFSSNHDAYLQTYKLYVDGDEYSTAHPDVSTYKSTFAHSSSISSTKFYIGQSFEGLIDEIVLAPGNVSTVQVRELFNNGTPADPIDVFGWSTSIDDEARWWRMGDGAIPDPHNPDAFVGYIWDDLHSTADDDQHRLELTGMTAENIISEGAQIQVQSSSSHSE